jgi:hypothetical protein
MSRPSAKQIEQLYKQTLSASKQFASYNFREFFVRKTEQKFAPLLSQSSSSAADGIDKQWWDARIKELEVLKRSGQINRTFQGPKLVVEHAKPITGKSLYWEPTPAMWDRSNDTV